MGVAPWSVARRTKFASQPSPSLRDLIAVLSISKVTGPSGRPLGDLPRQPCLTPTGRGVIRNRPARPPLDQAGDQPRCLAQRQTVLRADLLAEVVKSETWLDGIAKRQNEALAPMARYATSLRISWCRTTCRPSLMVPKGQDVPRQGAVILQHRSVAPESMIVAETVLRIQFSSTAPKSTQGCDICGIHARIF